MPVRIACVGGGPGGLFFGAMLKTMLPDASVTVFERNRAEDAFGFGVVFSDATLDRIDAADPVLRRGLAEHGVHWDSIEVWLKGDRHRCGGNGMAAIHRRTLLSLLQERAVRSGADVRFETECGDLDRLRRDYDLVVAADGANSGIREALGDVFGSRVETASAKFIWFGTTHLFDGLTFVHRGGPDGTFAAHAYPISDRLSTFIVETDERSWRAAGLDGFDTGQPAGPSDQASQSYLERLFATDIDGQALVGNNSRWGNFRTRRSTRWHHENVVLLGDAAHTAHFSVGSGTKMAMEDAISLSTRIAADPHDLPAALAAYQAERGPEVAKIQDSARPSLSWWERFGRYHASLDPWQFSVHFLTRSIPVAKIGRRDPAFVAAAEREWRTRHDGADPLGSPLRLPGVVLPGRLLRAVPVAEGTPSGADGIRLVADDGTAVPPSLVTTVRAPDTEDGLPAAEAEIDKAVAGNRTVIAVHGGTRLTRVLLCEAARLFRGAVGVVIEPGPGIDRAATLVLAGRADAVAIDAVWSDGR